MRQTEPVSRWVLHVDLDQFLAAVEVLRHPELAGRPVVVGGDGDTTKRGVVSTASYEARAFGVRSGMALRTAARRLDGRGAVFLPVDKPVYEAASAAVMTTLREFDVVVEEIGWDEAFIGAAVADDDEPEDLAGRILAAVLERTQLSCSVGIGRNKLQAKMATGFGKPAGVYRITGATWFEHFGNQSPDVLWGIGSRTAAKLAELGIGSVGELAAADDAVLAARFGPAIGPWLGRMGRGEDPSPVVGDPWVRKSRSREVTFQQDLTSWDAIRAETAQITRLVVDDVTADERLVGRVGVKIRWVPFSTQVSARKVSEPTLDAGPLVAAALEVLEKLGDGPISDDRQRTVRLLGVRLEFADTL